jgi:hypothetical protein
LNNKPSKRRGEADSKVSPPPVSAPLMHIYSTLNMEEICFSET